MNEIVGKPIDRVDGKLKVTGGATYSAEYFPKNMVYGVLVVSTIPKGRIRNIDTSQAERVKGIVGIMTYKNSMSLHFPQGSDLGSSGKYAEKDLLPLQNDRIHYDGQVIAAVMAETFEEAEYAAKLVKVNYETESPIFDLKANVSKSYKPATGFGGSQLQLKRGDADAALQNAEVKMEQTYTTPVYHHNAMEPHATVAEWNGDQLMVYDATQAVAGVRGLLASMLGLLPEKVKVVALFIGGGFGSKGFTWPNPIVTAMAAKMVNRPVKLVLSRQQMFTTAGRRSQTIQKITLASNRSGKLTAIKHDTTSESSFVDEFVETAGLATSMLYSCPNVEISHSLVRLNKVTPCPTRAPGEAPGTYAIEAAMDELAYQLKMDPIQLRLVNYAEMDEQRQKKFSSKNLKECYQRGADTIGWSQRNPEPRSMREGSYLVGYGMATATYLANRSASAAKATLFADGHAEILSATQDIGTGTYTIMTQIAADAFGLPVDKVTVKLGNSDYPMAANSGGSQVTASVGPPIRAAALGVIGKLISLAVSDTGSPLHGHKEEDIVADNGRIYIKNHTDKGESYTEVLNRKGLQKLEALAKTNVSTRGSSPAATGGADAAAEEESKTNPAVQEDQNVDRKPYSFHSFGAHFVKVLVDPDLGTVKVDKAVAVMDIGKVLNLKTAKNQIMGGMIFAIGMALLEETAYDPNNGRVVTRDLAQYLVPVNADMPQFDIQFIDRPDPYISPIGAKGIGEIGITGMTAAVVNAIYHATGKRVRELPVTLDKLI
jgi:xanthine dehydrogenase YagR molybdenum-binding subunit